MPKSPNYFKEFEEMSKKHLKTETIQRKNILMNYQEIFKH
jgi:hypothetical protein